MMENKQISLEGLSVVLGMPATRDIPALTVRSLLGSQQICRDYNIPFGFALVSGNAVIEWARDEVIYQFLQSDATRLFMIDSDIVWEPSSLMRILALTQMHEVVVGSYPNKKEPSSFYILHDEEKGLTQNELGLCEILGAGLGFTCVRRNVIEELVDKHGTVYDEISQTNIPRVFHTSITEDGKRMGEDMTFFKDIRDLGYKVYLDPSVNLQHYGMKCYEGNLISCLSQTTKVI